MDNLIRESGNRLREVRHIFNEGDKLSAKQFAYLLDETQDRILNYENGRAAISLQLLANLYHRGVNPVYILTGEGEIFAENEAGKALKAKTRTSANRQATVVAIDNLQGLSIGEMLIKAEQYSAAAGDILKILKEKSAEGKD
jgi:transcriptional regulator with XRE-family HTH domain